MRQYQELLRRILTTGEDHNDRTGVGTISRFGDQIRFDLREGFPITTTKRIPFRWIVEELLWFLRGDTNEKHLRERGVDIWQEWATAEQCARFGRKEGDLGPVYGFLWRHFGGDYNYIRDYGVVALATTEQQSGVDQIAEALHDIQFNSGSRRIIVTGWHPQHAREVALPPCHTLFQFKVHSDQYLSCHLYARSIDSFLGLPFNIASYALLTHIMAALTGNEPKELIISFGDVHIYKNHLDQVNELLSRTPRELPTLNIVNWQEVHRLGINGLAALKAEHFTLTGYNPHPKIEAPVAV